MLEELELRRSQLIAQAQALQTQVEEGQKALYRLEGAVGILNEQIANRDIGKQAGDSIAEWHRDVARDLAHD